MSSFLEFIGLLMDWSEIWILLLPLALVFIKKDQPVYMKPIIVYLWLAFIFNFICDGMFLVLHDLPANLKSNTIFYNLHSLSRFICFVVFFFRIKLKYYYRLKWVLVATFSILFLLYFTFYDSFFNKTHISSDMMSGESFFLLFFSMLYYLSVLKGSNPRFGNRKDFWVVTGLCIFEVINFFLFLFYQPLLDQNADLAESIWTIHNIAFILFILFISKAIYVPDSNKH